MTSNFLGPNMIKTILVFGGFAVVLALLFQLEKWSLFALGNSQSWLFLIASVIFIMIGIVTNRIISEAKSHKKLSHPNSILSTQEFKVLHLIADGKSNREIGELLFISETTVKSHVSSILQKLKAKRRTEAVKIGRELQII